MRALHREWDELLELAAPPLLDVEVLERLVTADELGQLDDCTEHDGCRAITP